MGLMLWHGAGRDDALLNLGLLAESSLCHRGPAPRGPARSATALLNHAPSGLPATPLPLFNSANTRPGAGGAGMAPPAQLDATRRSRLRPAGPGAGSTPSIWCCAAQASQRWRWLGRCGYPGRAGASHPDLAGPARTLQQRHLGRAAASTKPSHSLERHAPAPAAARPHCGMPCWAWALHSQAAANPRIAALLQHSYASPATVLAVDLPSGLQVRHRPVASGVCTANTAPQPQPPTAPP